MLNATSSSEYQKIPAPTMGALLRYGNDHQSVGGFLTACLEGKFVDAVCRADTDNLKAIREIALFLYNELPWAAQGSPEKVEKWLTMAPRKTT